MLRVVGHGSNINRVDGSAIEEEADGGGRELRAVDVKIRGEVGRGDSAETEGAIGAVGMPVDGVGAGIL